MNITEIVPKNNYLLYIEADDGQTGLFDVAPYLEAEAFAPLKDHNEFERVHNGKYFIEWECGADLSADTIERRWTPVNIARRPGQGSVAISAYSGQVERTLT